MNRKSAFTLIELLVTIVIVGILSTMSLSTFNGYIEKARIASILAMEKIIDNVMIADSFRDGQGPVAKWDFFEGSGLTSTDLLNNSTISIAREELWIEDTIDGRAYSIDLTGGWPDRALASVSQTIGDNFSFAMRFRIPGEFDRTNSRKYMMFLYCDGSSNEYLRFSASLDGNRKNMSFTIRQRTDGFGGSLLNTPFVEIDYDWHHIAMSYTPEVLKFYLDGKLLQVQEDPPTLETCNSGNVTGFALGHRLPMYVDNFRVWRTPIDLAARKY